MEHTKATVELSYQLNINREYVDRDAAKEQSWFREDNADFWRHARMMEPVFKCLLHSREDKWLTVGDGRFGLDAIRMKRRGYKHVLPTDMNDLLLAESKRNGWIGDYRIENAEHLSFADNQFDYVLCKESYHHFPRPMLALYEMLRVAKKGVVLIEPQDQYADFPLTTGEAIAGYEDAGNYIYTLSRRELAKVALGLDLPVVAFKNIYDIFFVGVQNVIASDDNPVFVEFVSRVAAAEQACREQKMKHNYLLAVLFKERPKVEELDGFTKNAEGWSVTSNQGNPHIRAMDATPGGSSISTAIPVSVVPSPDLTAPHMPAAAAEALHNYLVKANVYVEFGAGGSTVLAAGLGVPNIISVDSSEEWTRKVAEQIGRSSYSGNLLALHANIGATKEWGYPKDTSDLAKWPSYYSDPWRLLKEKKLTPDLVLIDGRFRVCCFLMALIHLKPGTVILWDDYRDRPEYHMVESFIQPQRFHDHMAEFVSAGTLDISAVTDLLFQMLFVLD